MNTPLRTQFRPFARVGWNAAATVALSACLSLAACTGPSRDAPSPAEVDRAIEQMVANPVPLERPVVVINGFQPVRLPKLIAPSKLTDDAIVRLARMTSGDPGDFVVVDSVGVYSVAELAWRITRTAEDAFGPGVLDDASHRGDLPVRGVRTAVIPVGINEDPAVDVIGISMGGLGGIFATAGTPTRHDQPTLRTGTLFTIATPHRGAELALTPLPAPAVADEMRRGSEVLASAASASARFADWSNAGKSSTPTLIAYGLSRDPVVGPANAFPPHRDELHWVRGRRVLSHVLAVQDDLILADIARRLRGEEPLITPAPLP